MTLQVKGWAGLTARLQWPDGSPAAGVQASWIGTSHRSGHLGASWGEADGAGVLTIADLSSGGGELRIQGHAYHEPVGLRVERGAVTDLGTLTVAKLVRVEGRVVASEGQHLPTELNVIALRSGGVFAQSQLKSGRTFQFDVPPGPVVLALSKPIAWDPILPFRGSFLGQVDVNAPQSGVELPLQTALAEVTGDAGLPKAQLRIVLFPPHPSVSWGIQNLGDGFIDSVSDNDGNFSAPVQPAGARVLVRRDDGSTAYTNLVQLKEGAPHDLGALSFATGTVLVTTRDADGSP